MVKLWQTVRQIVIFAVAMNLLLAGCGQEESKIGGGGTATPTNPKINPENFAKIKDGMSVKDVEALLGPGVEQIGAIDGARYFADLVSAKIMKWNYGPGPIYEIVVGFVDGKVVARRRVPPESVPMGSAKR
jgi:hypothetical protein